MKQKVKLGIVCLARTTFDYQAAEQIYETIKKDLQKLENTEIAAIDKLVIEIEDARAAANRLAREQVDALVCISGTFHLGHLILEMNRELQKPVLLWGLNELPYDGGKIRLNSVCGVNLNASNLYKAGVKNYTVHVGDTIDEDWVDAIRIEVALRTAHVGLAGFRAHGFFNLGVYDLTAYRDFGVLIDHYELADIFDFKVEEKLIALRSEEVKDTFDISGVTTTQVDKVAALAAKIDAFMEANSLTALALRCWPEFADRYGISPCAAMSLLQSQNRIIACEGDVEGALSMIAHRAVGAETPFLFDFSQINFEENYALLWHCGVAPANLHDGRSVRSLDTYFAGGRGVTADFVLKEGDVSILRFDGTADEYRLFLQRAEGIPMEKELRGTYLKVKFENNVRDVMDSVVYNGVAHHASMVYGDYIRPFEIFARIKNWRVIT